jgi:hypothetical protein
VLLLVEQAISKFLVKFVIHVHLVAQHAQVQIVQLVILDLRRKIIFAPTLVETDGMMQVLIVNLVILSAPRAQDPVLIVDHVQLVKLKHHQLVHLVLPRAQLVQHHQQLAQVVQDPSFCRDLLVLLTHLAQLVLSLSTMFVSRVQPLVLLVQDLQPIVSLVQLVFCLTMLVQSLVLQDSLSLEVQLVAQMLVVLVLISILAQLVTMGSI